MRNTVNFFSGLLIEKVAVFLFSGPLQSRLSIFWNGNESLWCLLLDKPRF